MELQIEELFGITWRQFRTKTIPDFFKISFNFGHIITKFFIKIFVAHSLTVPNISKRECELNPSLLSEH